MASAVAKAFESILSRAPTPRMLQTNKETEFVNSTFQKLLKKYNIHFYTAKNEDIKAAVVERFNRSLKTKMYRYFTFQNTSHSVDVLQTSTMQHHIDLSACRPTRSIKKTNSKLKCAYIQKKRNRKPVGILT